MNTEFEEWLEKFKANSEVSLNTDVTNIAFEAWKAGFDFAVEHGVEFARVETLCEIKYLELTDWENIRGLVLEGYGSWRGSYNEPCLYIREDPDGRITPHDLEVARKALLSETFYGYKGGEYNYYEHYRLNVEVYSSSWSDGQYIQRLLMKHPDFRTLFKD